MAEKPYRVLVVDDDFASLEVLALLLKSEGFEVITASNGQAALARLAQASVDVVITDYKMPVMDGSELCHHLLADQRFAKLPVIFISATYRQDVQRPGNVAAFFNKPLLFTDVLRALREILQSPVAPPLA